MTRCIRMVVLLTGLLLASPMIQGEAAAAPGSPVAAPPAGLSGRGAAPQGEYSFYGSLDAGYIVYYGPYYEQPGALLSIQINYTPASAAVQLGICTSTTQGG